MKNNLEQQDIINLRICYKFLEGENLPRKFKKQERYFELKKNNDEAQKFCQNFEREFNKRLNYKIFRGNAYFGYETKN